VAFSMPFALPRLAIATCILLMIFGILQSGPQAFALEDGRIGVLYVGCITRSKPFWVMRSDPLFRFSFVGASLRFWEAGPMPVADESEVYRRVRMYMPRTYEDLVANYDVIVMHNANVLVVGPCIDKLARGVSEGGLGLLMSGGWESFGGTGSSSPPWGETSIGRLLPTEDIVGIWDESGRLVIDKPEHELISSLRWDMNDPDLTASIKWHHNPVTLRLGAGQLARVISGSGRQDPLMATWRLGKGARVFALTSEIHGLCWQGGLYGNAWRYCVDFGCNLMIYLDDRAVPQDIELVHAARSKMSEVGTRSPCSCPFWNSASPSARIRRG